MCVAIAARIDLDTQHDFSLVSEFDGIAYEVHYDLAETEGIAYQCIGHVSVDVARQLKPFLVSPWSKDSQGVFERITKVESYMVELQLAGFNLGKVEKIVDQCEQGTG